MKELKPKNITGKAQIRISIEIDLAKIETDANKNLIKTNRRRFSSIEPKNSRSRVAF